nr:MAG TPA: hypothetical protein [Caudoviricetes sp.]
MLSQNYFKFLLTNIKNLCILKSHHKYSIFKKRG